MPMIDEPSNAPSNLWLADTLWRLGAVQFGDFTLGRTTVPSPMYVNLRLLIAHPTALARAARLLLQEIQTLQAMRNPQIDPFDVVCGVPFGGLIIAQAFSLTAKTPQSMQSAGSITRKSGPSWKHSTGQTDTQSVYLPRMHASVTTRVLRAPVSPPCLLPMTRRPSSDRS